MSEDEYSDPFDEEHTMEICIETLTGTSFEMKVNPHDVVLNIKNKIQRVEGTCYGYIFVKFNTAPVTATCNYQNNNICVGYVTGGAVKHHPGSFAA